MEHLTGIDQLEKDDIESYLERAQYYADALKNDKWDKDLLKNKIILHLFFENSTRTLTSFEMAGKRLGAHVINWNKETSSLSKGESFADTIDTLNMMHPDAVVVRHSEYNAPNYLAKRMNCPVINGGDSWREHPTQALLDALTIRQHCGDFAGLTIAIIGDIAHSRVASSNMQLLTKMGATIRVIAPEVLMPEKLSADGVERFIDLDEGLKDADVAMTIRPQKERMDKVLIDDVAYYRDYGLTHERMKHAKDNAIVMDPGPFLRELQISNELADDKEIFIYHEQVANGIPTRMAVLDLLVSE
ncbi:MAG: aspartate carbamoyltransferase catalytic subunit [Pseudomonadota bacterium]